jgi:Rieske Fe-S protein
MSDDATPKWRKDFPITWGADNYVTRREFTKFLVLVSGATVAGNAYFVLRKRESIGHPSIPKEVGLVDDLQPGQVKLIYYPTDEDPALLIRLTDGEYVAYKQQCTHLSCPVHYAAQRNRLECPCHNGAFDASTGAVLEGPPPRPLPRIKLRMADGKIIAEGVQGA